MCLELAIQIHSCMLFQSIACMLQPSWVSPATLLNVLSVLSLSFSVKALANVISSFGLRELPAVVVCQLNFVWLVRTLVVQLAVHPPDNPLL